jgi:flotillin
MFAELSPTLFMLAAAMVTLLVLFVFFGIWASRYTKVGPNRVLVVSGRKQRLADGTVVGCRIVKGGGTFVYPVLERVDVLSLEVLPLDLPRVRVRASDGVPMEAEVAAQIKIKAEDVSLWRAAENLLGKSSAEINTVARQLLDKHLHAVLGAMTPEEIRLHLGAAAASVQTALAEDLDKLGVGLVSFQLRDCAESSAGQSRGSVSPTPASGTHT